MLIYGLINVNNYLENIFQDPSKATYGRFIFEYQKIKFGIA